MAKAPMEIESFIPIGFTDDAHYVIRTIALNVRPNRSIEVDDGCMDVFVAYRSLEKIKASECAIFFNIDPILRHIRVVQINGSECKKESIVMETIHTQFKQLSAAFSEFTSPIAKYVYTPNRACMFAQIPGTMFKPFLNIMANQQLDTTAVFLYHSQDKVQPVHKA